jgi:hypothetical protein
MLIGLARFVKNHSFVFGNALFSWLRIFVTSIRATGYQRQQKKEYYYLGKCVHFTGIIILMNQTKSQFCIALYLYTLLPLYQKLFTAILLNPFTTV